MAAGSLQFAALDLDLSEESRVLDCQGGLGREGLQQFDHLRIKGSGTLAIHCEPAEDVVLAQ